jgi:hypothetical protein
VGGSIGFTVRQRWPVDSKERQGGDAVSTAASGLVGPDARLAAETQASLVESPRFLFQPWEQNPLPRVSSRPQCQFGVMICSRQGLVLRMDNSPKAFLAAHVSPRKTAGLAIGAIACELATRAL